jgi:endonuclease/exonuclease/phosphatase family metal-dependent hydrolase
MSANLRWGQACPGALVEQVRRLGVDAVGLQELGPAQADAIARELPFGLLAPAAGAAGTGIALRHPAKVDLVPMRFRPLHVAVLEPDAWPGLAEPLEFAATHFAAPHVKPYGSGVWYRSRQLRDIEAYLRSTPRERRVLVGDFNATPVWPAYRRIASHLTDAAVEVAQVRGRPLRRTWGPWPGSSRWLRIDHAFVRGVRAVDFQVVPIDGSDHDAIVIDLSFDF